MPRILVVDAWMPSEDTDSASIRLIHIMRLLRQLGAEVTFFPDDLDAGRGAVSALRQAGVTLVGAPGAASLEAHILSVPQPYDVVWLSRVYVAEKHFQLVRRASPASVLVFDTVSLHHLQVFRWAKQQRNAFLLKTAMENKRQELAMAADAELTLVVSTHEFDVIARDCPAARPALIPTLHEANPSPASPAGRAGLLFVGGFTHQGNVDSMRYYVDEILPLLRARLPGTPTTVVGIKPPDWLLAQQAPDLIVTGHVPDIAPFFDRCRASIAPIRFGSGVKGKVMQSMGLGVPVVGTPMAAEGIPAVAGRHLLVADNARDFCDRVHDVATQDALWQSLSDEGRRFVNEHFSAERMKVRLRDMLDRLASGHRAGR